MRDLVRESRNASRPWRSSLAWRRSRRFPKRNQRQRRQCNSRRPAYAHAALGLLRLLDDWDWESADAELERAVELAQGDSYVRWKRGMYLQYAGRFDEAVAEHRRAEQLDPLSLVAIEVGGWPLYYSR